MGSRLIFFPSNHGSICQLLMNGSVVRGKEYHWVYGEGLFQSRTIDFLKMDQNSVNISLIWKSGEVWYSPRVGLRGSDVGLIIYLIICSFYYSK